MTADCVLLGYDPLADIEALTTANLVVRQGRVVYARPTHALSPADSAQQRMSSPATYSPPSEEMTAVAQGVPPRSSM